MCQRGYCRAGNRFPIGSTPHWCKVLNIENTDKYGCKDPTFCTEQIFALNITDLHDRMDGYMLEGEYAFQGQYGNLLAINTADAFEPATQALDPRYAYLKKAYSHVRK